MFRLFKTVVAFAVVVIIALVVAAAVSSHSDNNTPPPASAVGKPPGFEVSGVSVLALDDSHISVDFSVLNNGNAAGTPGCIITATAPSGVKSVGSVLLSRVTIGESDIALDQKVTIRDHDAASITVQGLAVSCSPL